MQYANWQMAKTTADRHMKLEVNQLPTIGNQPIIAHQIMLFCLFGTKSIIYNNEGLCRICGL